MSFASETKEQALVACMRSCCICHRFRGIKIELHHIVHKSEGGTDLFDNCIPLCFDCHGDMRSYDHNHPKGTKYSPSELKRHRDEWYKKVRELPIGTNPENIPELDAEIVDEDFYTLLVNAATEGLNLKSWDGISDHAIRSIVPTSFVDGVDAFTAQVFKAIWLGEKPQLEDAIKNLAARVNGFVKHFLSRARIREEGFYVEDLRWKAETMHYEIRDKQYAESNKWRDKSAELLVNLVIALNEFGDAVRQDLNPKYFLLQGRFTLHDSLGVTNEMRDIHYMPSTYIDVG